MLNQPSLKRLAARLMRFFPHWLYHILVRLTQAPFRVGVTAFVFDPSGRVLLLEHVFRLTYQWGPPGGWLKRGEDPVVALGRELMEETGLAVVVRVPLRVAVRGGEMEIMYLATCAGGRVHPSGEILGGGGSSDLQEASSPAKTLTQMARSVFFRASQRSDLFDFEAVDSDDIPQASLFIAVCRVSHLQALP